MEVGSNTITAGDAISKIIDVRGQALTDETATLSFSNVTSMSGLTAVSNQLVHDVSCLIDCAYKQANRVERLASKKQRDDLSDQNMFLQW